MAIKEAILEHYKKILGTERTRKSVFDNSGFQNMTIFDEAGNSLCKMVTDEEIKKALWSIKNDKSPGLDGFNSFFFKKVWNIVGKEICYAI